MGKLEGPREHSPCHDWQWRPLGHQKTDLIGRDRGPYSIWLRALLDKPGPPIWVTLSSSLAGGHPPPCPYPSPCVRERALLHEQPWARDHQLLQCHLLPGLGQCILNSLMPLNHTATSGKNRPRAMFLSTSPRMQCPRPLSAICAKVGQRHPKACSQPSWKAEFSSEKQGWSAPGTACRYRR